MKLKGSVLAVLVGLNVLLLLALFIQVDPTPQARAQAGGGGRGYVCVTAAATGADFEILYIADLAGRKLHYFAPSDPRNRTLEYLGARDLNADFRNEETKP